MKRDYILVAISLFLWGVGEGIFYYFQPIALERWNATPVLIGGVLGATGIVIALSQTPSGLLTDRYGARPIMWFSWVAGTLAAAVMWLSNSLNMFIAGLMLYGLSSFVLAPMYSYVTNVRGNMSVERALTIVSAAYNFGIVLGPLIGGWVGDHMDLRSIYMISTVIFCFSTIIILFIRPQRLSQSHLNETAPAQNLLKNPKLVALLFVMSITFFALFLPQPLAPNFLQNQQHLSLTQIGVLGAVGGLGNSLMALIFGALPSFKGLLLGQIFVAGYAFLLWQSSSFPLFAVGYFLLGGYRLSKTMAIAFISRLVNPSETGLAFGLMETTHAIAMITAPILAGFIYSSNPTAIFAISLILLILTIVINLLTLPQLKNKNIQLTEGGIQNAP